MGFSDCVLIMHQLKKYLAPIQSVFITNGAGEKGEKRMNEGKVNWLFLRGYYKDGNQIKGASVQLRQHEKRTPVSKGRTTMWIKFCKHVFEADCQWNSWFNLRLTCDGTVGLIGCCVAEVQTSKRTYFTLICRFCFSISICSLATAIESWGQGSGGRQSSGGKWIATIVRRISTREIWL